MRPAAGPATMRLEAAEAQAALLAWTHCIVRRAAVEAVDMIEVVLVALDVGDAAAGAAGLVVEVNAAAGAAGHVVVVMMSSPVAGVYWRAGARCLGDF